MVVQEVAERIADELKAVIEIREPIEGRGSVANIVAAANILDSEFNRAFSSGSGPKFDDNGELIPMPGGFKVDGFATFKFLDYMTYIGINYNNDYYIIEVEGSIMEDYYKLTFFRSNNELTNKSKLEG